MAIVRVTVAPSAAEQEPFEAAVLETVKDVTATAVLGPVASAPGQDGASGGQAG